MLATVCLVEKRDTDWLVYSGANQAQGLRLRTLNGDERMACKCQDSVGLNVSLSLAMPESDLLD